MNTFVPAARRPEDSGLTMYENSRGGSRMAAAGSMSGTPVFDALVVEFRANFRTVPGDPWSPQPAPRFAELSVRSDRFGLPPGQGGL
ncbi:hypothetical protein ABIA35_005873 [Catenulispora sp. MAP12-49]